MPYRPDHHELSIEPADGLRHEIDIQWLRHRLTAAIEVIEQSSGRSPVQIGVRIVSDDEMTRLHQDHSGINESTDVLTFDLSDEGKAATSIHAEIAVCADEATRRAADLGHSIERELLLYMIHGVLHCCGHDDHTETGYAAMHAEEDRILRDIGIGDTFNPDARTGRGGNAAS